MGWNDVGSSSTSDKQEIKYMGLLEGTHQIRCLDAEPVSRWTHWIPQANAGKGYTVNCAGKDCPVCAEIKAAKAKKAPAKMNSRKLHLMNVIDRASGEVKLIDKGNGLFEALYGIYEELKADNGDLTNYDLKIRVSGSGKDTVYTPIPMPVKPLTKDEKALEKYDREKLSESLTVEQITALMGGATFKEVFGSEDDDSDATGDEKPNVDFTKEG